ncbi:S9 family peptidase [Lysinibacillus sp. 54212]|uniref:S9 family peptidase n=1 Tax=Lysinibacillus sp. 54212 TaxID=3119829 RepID=UPI002FCC059B
MSTVLTTDHLLALQSVASPVLSPSNEEAVFIRTLIDKEDNKYYAHLFHIELESDAITQWTFGKERVSSPKWSPNGKQVAFLSDRKDKKQLYVVNVRGGEAKRITDFAFGVSSFEWSPCGEKLWVAGAVKEGKKITDKIEEEANKQPQAYVVQGMKYKMDGLGGGGLRSQDVFTQIASISLVDEVVEQFTEGNYNHSLSGISRDGKSLIISVNRAENLDFDFSQPLFIVDVETKKETVLVHEEGYYGGAAFSFDNRYIAYVGSDSAYKNASHANVYIYDTETGITQNVTEAIDAPVGDYAVADVQQGVNAPAVVWTETNALYFQLSTMGDVRLYYGDLEGSIFPASAEGEHIYDYSIANNGNWALIAVSNSTFPGELFYFDITTSTRRPLTSFNEAVVQEVTFSEPEPIVYKTSAGDVHGWIMKPTQFKEGEKYPLIVEVHGGPHTMYANSFFHELQLLASQGYGVLYVNPRGSHSYSQAFVDGVRGDYGGGDYEDIMIGLDYALAHYEWIDESRLGVTGGSYGGFMTNWIVGHTDRFKAAVTQRSISNWISFFGVSDIGYYFSEWQILSDMKSPDKLWDHSPLKYAENVSTPLLILHSEKDFRCPIEQAEQLYITLKSQGKEVGFVRFPDSDHNLSRTGLPNLRIERLEQIVSWFKKFL